VIALRAVRLSIAVGIAVVAGMPANVRAQMEPPVVPDLPEAPPEPSEFVPPPPPPARPLTPPRRRDVQTYPPESEGEPPPEATTAKEPPTLVAAPPSEPSTPPSAASEPPPAAPEAAPGPAADQPLAGFSDGAAFLRSPDNNFILFPSGRLQIDGYFFSSDNKTPNNTFLIRRARLETTGWIGPMFYFSLAGDFAAGPASTTAAPVAQANAVTTDVFVTFAPLDTWLMVQAGQYDAPFTLENRTSDKYFDFMERSITVRAFGIPTNKEMGAMIYGYNPSKNFHYSLGLFNGDGQNFKNADSQFDVIGRFWIAPFSFIGDGPLHDAEVGFSFWRGDRANTLPLSNQTTQGGFTFLSFNAYDAMVGGNTVSTQLRQVGLLNAVAGELNVPVAHRFGARGELVWKKASLSEENVKTPSTPVILGGAELEGYAFYGELFWWILGDDKIIGDQQGLEPLSRLKKFGVSAPRDGLMLAFRAEYLNEDVTLESDAAALNLKDGAVGKTKVMSYELGLNYWHSKRFRATFNYVFNHFSGDTGQIKKLASPNEQEFLFRLGIAL